jgi:hypothetical protein
MSSQQRIDLAPANAIKSRGQYERASLLRKNPANSTGKCAIPTSSNFSPIFSPSSISEKVTAKIKICRNEPNPKSDQSPATRPSPR